MRNDKEYILYRAIANYLRLQYPKVQFHFDLSGLNLSKAQAGKNKGIQKGKGWPDLFIAEPTKEFNGLFIEIKAVNIWRKDGTLLQNEHLRDQADMLQKLSEKGYKACFGRYFDGCKEIIDNYLNYDSRLISILFLMEKHPELNKEQSEKLLKFCNEHTINDKDCYGNGEKMFPKWKESINKK